MPDPLLHGHSEHRECAHCGRDSTPRFESPRTYWQRHPLDDHWVCAGCWTQEMENASITGSQIYG
jgi:hypothetical protein